MRLWDVNVSLLVYALNNEAAVETVRLFLENHPKGRPLDYNFMVHSVDDAECKSLAALRDEQRSPTEPRSRQSEKH